MARKYPRFLFSDPKDSKSKGPFIIHTMNPQFIAKIFKFSNGDIDLKIIDDWDPDNPNIKADFNTPLIAMEKWIKGQMLSKKIFIQWESVEIFPYNNPFY